MLVNNVKTHPKGLVLINNVHYDFVVNKVPHITFYKEFSSFDISVSAGICVDIREVKLHVYFSRERQKGNFYRLPFIAQYVKVSSFVFGVSQ